MGEVKIQSHKVGPISYRLTSLSFQVNRPSHSWDTAFSTFDAKSPPDTKPDWGYGDQVL